MRSFWNWCSFALAVLASSVIGEEGLSMRVIAEMSEVVEGDPIEVDVAGSLVAVASDVELRLIDISDPEVPVLRGTLAIETPIDLATNGSVVAFITEGRSLHLVDVRQPDHPRLATVLEPEPFGPTDHLEYESVDFDERGLLYVVRNFDYRGYYGRLHVYNVDAPDGPQEIGVGTTGFALGKVAVSGDRAFASGLFLSSDWTMGINLWAIFDISSPGSPEFCTRIDWAG
ncbi:MAG: hypothetical protein KDA28_00775, partial [Phycisphaerales bacterium]|nr:hypothetical protein [Phycisphaerales bacterium]